MVRAAINPSSQPHHSPGPTQHSRDQAGPRGDGSQSSDASHTGCVYQHGRPRRMNVDVRGLASDSSDVSHPPRLIPAQHTHGPCTCCLRGATSNDALCSVLTPSVLLPTGAIQLGGNAGAAALRKDGHAERNSLQHLPLRSLQVCR